MRPKLPNIILCIFCTWHFAVSLDLGHNITNLVSFNRPMPKCTYNLMSRATQIVQAFAQNTNINALSTLIDMMLFRS